MKNKKALWSTLIVVTITFILYTIGKTIITGMTDVTILQMFAREVLFTILALIAAKVTGKLGYLKFTTKGFGTGLLAGMWFICQDTLTLFVYLGDVHVTVSAGLIVLFAISMVLVGLCEETLFRGVLLNGMLDAFGDDNLSSVWKAVIASGVTFGALHIFNVLTGASFVGSLTQALTAIPSGMLFAAVYLRSGKNIWPCVLIHGYGDACSFISDNILSGATFANIVGGYSPIMLITSAVELAAVIFVLRKKKMQPLIDKDFKL